MPEGYLIYRMHHLADLTFMCKDYVFPLTARARRDTGDLKRDSSAGVSACHCPLFMFRFRGGTGAGRTGAGA